MSFVDLATLAMHRRQEMEARLNVFLKKCDRAVKDIKKLQNQAQGFLEQLNCEPSELRDKFLSCMKQLDEYNYLITDFNLALDNLDRPLNSSTYYMPVHDNPTQVLKPLTPLPAMNLIDALSEPTPSTSKACANNCPQDKAIKKRKVPKEEQVLIAFSSTSCSSESVPYLKMEQEVQCNLENGVDKLSLNDSQPSNPTVEECNLPAQKILQLDYMYRATITYVDGLSFWVITEEFEDAHNMMREMNEHYRVNEHTLSLDEIMSLTYCALYEVDSDCFYRAFFIRLTEEDVSIAEVFLVDIGETCCVPTTAIQPLEPRFCTKPPFARCCHLAGVDLLVQPAKAQEFLKELINKPCQVKIDDNSSESLGAYVYYLSGESLSDVLVQRGLARRIDKTSMERSAPVRGLPELDESNFNIDDCPEYDDPLLAVAGYHNRDEMDICKHYKGGPEKTCFKGRRCTKRHVLINPDGWTLDQVSVVAKCVPMPLPAPDTHFRVYVTHVAHFNRFYVQLTDRTAKQEAIKDFGVVLPPTSLNALVLDMNSPASRMAYKPLQLVPAPGEMVAALYPPDEQWYRARVISSTRADQNVEVMYIDYGNVIWVKEDAVRVLEPRYWPLPAQAVRCALAGVVAKTADSRQWAAAKEALTKMIHERVLQAHVIARDYDEITVELFDEHGYSIAEQLAAGQHVKLEEYEIAYDADVTQKVIVP